MDNAEIKTGDTVWVIDGLTVRPVVVDKNGRTKFNICGVPPGWRQGQPLPETCFPVDDAFPSEEAAVFALWRRLVDAIRDAEGRAAVAARSLIRFKKWLLSQHLEIPS